MDKKKIIVLFVDDESSVLNSYKEFFDSEMTCFFTSKPKEALEILENKKPQILVTDYNLMCEKFGTDIIIEAKKLNENIKCLLVSGQLDLNLAKQMNKLGVKIFDKLTDNDLIGTEIIESYKTYLDYQELLKNSLTGSFASQFMHDASNSLQSISFGVHMAIKNLESTDESKKTPEVIKERLEKAQTSVVNFQKTQSHFKSKMSGIENLQLQKVNFLKFINNAKQEIIDICEANQFEFKEEYIGVTEDDFVLMTNDALISHVLNNLVINAVQANEQNPEKWIKIKYEANYNGILKIQVTDSGKSLSEEIQQKLFQEKFTTKGEKGTGNGLINCKKNIEEIFGEINYNKHSKNCSFLIQIPFQRAKAENQAA